MRGEVIDDQLTHCNSCFQYSRRLMWLQNYVWQIAQPIIEAGFICVDVERGITEPLCLVSDGRGWVVGGE